MRTLIEVILAVVLVSFIRNAEEKEKKEAYNKGLKEGQAKN
jgi:hypothetical protein